jgi:hypothetical protein
LLWDEPKIFFLERRYFFSIILSEFLKNRVALHFPKRKVKLRESPAKLREKWKTRRILSLTDCETGQPHNQSK